MLAAFDDVDHAPDDRTVKAANCQRGMSVAMPRPLCGIVIDRFGGRGWSFALSVHKSPVPVA
jgi:hypothetical protein